MRFPGNINSKFPKMGTTIFSVMTALAKEHNAINLSQGFPEFEPNKIVLDAFSNAIQSSNHQYAPMPGMLPLREAIAEKINSLYSLIVNPEKEITITAGASQAIFTAIVAIVKEKDEVIVFAPSYDSYVPSIEVMGALPVYYAMEAPDFSIKWDKVAKLVTQKTKMIIINSPHNPTSKLLTADDIKQLEKIVKGTEIIILSDEVYEHIVFDEKKHLSVLQNKTLAEKSIAVFSFGKTYHTTGWKIGYVVAPENITAEFRKLHQYNVFSVSTPSQIAYTEILKHKELYLELSAFYQEKRNYFQSALSSSRFTLLPSEGTYFQLASFENISELNDKDFTKWLTREKGVAAIPISVFYPNQKDEKIVRFCFAKESETLKRAAEWLNKI
jgi:methionine aminotransferase